MSMLFKLVGEDNYIVGYFRKALQVKYEGRFSVLCFLGVNVINN